MEKDITEYSIEEILEEYSDIVDDLKIDGYMENDLDIAKRIVLVVMAGINRNHHEDILDVILKMCDSKRNELDDSNVSDAKRVKRILSEDRKQSLVDRQYHYSTEDDLLDNDIEYESDTQYDMAQGPNEEKGYVPSHFDELHNPYGNRRKY